MSERPIEAAWAKGRDCEPSFYGGGGDHDNCDGTTTVKGHPEPVPCRCDCHKPLTNHERHKLRRLLDTIKD